jgi:hypothetical protein
VFRGGVDEFIEWSAERLTLYASTWHFTGNQFVEVEGDTAWMESSVQAYHRTSPADDAPAVDVILHLRYVDVLERRLGQWRILDRTLVFDSEATVPVGSALRPEWPASTRGRTDASYAAALVAKQRAGGGSQRLQVWGLLQE